MKRGTMSEMHIFDITDFLTNWGVDFKCFLLAVAFDRFFTTQRNQIFFEFYGNINGSILGRSLYQYDLFGLVFSTFKFAKQCITI